MRIVVAAVEDFGNVGLHLAAALNAATPHSAVLVRERPHPFDYDRLWRGAAPLIEGGADEAVAAFEAADVVIWKDDRAQAVGLWGRVCRAGCRHVVTAEGNGFRRNPDAFLRLAESADAVVALTADLAVRGIRYLPQCYPFWQRSWQLRGPVTLAHVVGRNRATKGTDGIWLPGVELLRGWGHEFEAELIECVPHAEAVERRGRATLVFDQAAEGFGAYGMNAIECMAEGIPVIGYVNQRSRAQAGGQLAMCPVRSIRELSAEGFAAAAAALLDSGYLETYSRQLFAWGRLQHGYYSAGARWGDFLEGLS